MPYNTTDAIRLSSHVGFDGTDPLENAREFIKNKLYLASFASPPAQTSDVHFFSVDDTLVYMNFYADFGPNNISHVIRFIEILGEKFRNPVTSNKKICVYSSMEGDKRANTAYFVCCYMMIVLKQTPDDAYKPLLGISPPFLPYRDAGYGAATYHLTVLDCLRGLHKGLTVGLLQLDTFDLEEYEFYEKVENGDFNWLSDKFLALASPHDDAPHPALMNQAQLGYGSFLSAFSRQKKGRFTSCYQIDNLIKYFKEKGVTTIIRLNNKLYDKKKFTDAGIEHIELYFPDGTTPPDHILKRFLEVVEARTGGIAIHCKAGLGRTGTLIAAYLMKHYKFTASEVIAYLRVMRPGSVVGPQQNYLQTMQPRLFRLHPATKLPPEISKLRPSTFSTNTRFIHCLPPGYQPEARPSPMDIDVDKSGTTEIEDLESTFESKVGTISKKSNAYSIPVQPRKAGTYDEETNSVVGSNPLLFTSSGVTKGWERPSSSSANQSSLSRIEVTAMSSTFGSVNYHTQGGPGRTDSQGINSLATRYYLRSAPRPTETKKEDKETMLTNGSSSGFVITGIGRTSLRDK